MTRIGLAFISDRGDMYLPECRKAFTRNVGWAFTATTVIDDQQHRLGMAGAVNAAWSWAIENDVDYLLHVEEDMHFTRTVDVQRLVDILDLNAELAEVTLVRQPWSQEEALAGGVAKKLGAIPHSCDCEDPPLRWSTQDYIFSLNPSLIPRRILELGWPAGNEAEMTSILLDRGYEFGLYGHPEDAPVIEHVGHVRGAGWRL